MVLLAVISMVALLDMFIIMIICGSLSSDSYGRIGRHVYGHNYQFFS